MLGQSAAIAKRPPHAAGSGYATQVEKTTVTAVSATAQSVAALGIPLCGCWFSFVSSGDCFIIFGRSDVPAATSANGYPMLAGVEYNWWINDTEDAFFSAIRSTVDGVLTRYRSNL